MVKEAEAHAAEDKQRREEVEVRNQADSLVYQAEKTIKEAGDKVDKALAEKVQTAADKLKETLKSGTLEQIKADTEELTKPLHELAGALYQQQQPQEGAAGAQQAGGAGKKQDDNVVDADFKVVDEDKK